MQTNRFLARVKLQRMRSAMLAAAMAVVWTGMAAETDPKFTAITPGSSSPGLVRTVVVEGERLQGVKKLRFVREATRSITFDVKATQTKLTGEAALPETAGAGSYTVEYSTDETAFQATKLTFSILPANEQYMECPLTTRTGSGPELLRVGKGVACTQALLDRKETSDIFGARIANMYLAVQVNIRNLNDEYNYLLHDVGLIVNEASGGEPVLVASRTKRLVRGVAEKGQVYDKRNVLVAIVRGTGTVLGGIAASPFATESFSQAINIFQGPFTSALTGQLPDFTVNQLNRLNDLGFETNSLVIPKGGSATAVAFISQRIFLDQGERDEFIQRRQYDKNKETRDALLKYQKRIHVAVAGFHVRRVEVDEPTLTGLEPSSGLKSSEQKVIALRGANLDRVAKIRLRRPGMEPKDGEVRLPDPLDATGATATITLDLPPETYSVYLLAADGAEKPTSLSFQVTGDLPTVVSTSLEKVAQGNRAPVKFVTTLGDQIKNIEAVQNDEADSGVTIEWTKREIAEWSGTVSVSAAAKEGEHLWRIRTKEGTTAKTGKKVVILAPAPGPLLLRVSVASVKIGAAETDVVFEGERLSGVSLESRQNGRNDPNVKVTLDEATRTENRIAGKIQASTGALVGEHVWWIKTGSGATETVQRLEVTK